MPAPSKDRIFDKFINRLDDFLYDRGLYTAGKEIKKKKFTTYDEVTDFLTENYYSEFESRRIVAKVKHQVLFFE